MRIDVLRRTADPEQMVKLPDNAADDIRRSVSEAKMRAFFKILTVALVLAGTMSVPQAQAGGGNRLLPTAQNPQKPETCRPKWPYVMLTCVA